MPRRSVIFLVLLAPLALGLVACGGGDDDEGESGLVDPAAATTTTRPTSTTGGQATSTTGSTSTTAEATTTTQHLPNLTTTSTAAPPATVASNDHGPEYFVLPSRNIGCYLNADVARCDIAERSWNPPPKPAECELEWGQGISLDAGGAGFVCAGDTVLGSETVLQYGSTAQRGAFVCESAQTGVTCRDTRNGAGFQMARAGYQIF